MPARFVQFTVYGLPVGQGSKRHVGGGVMVESSKHLKPWRAAIAEVAAAQAGEALMHGQVSIEARFCFPRPGSHFGTGRNAAALKASAPCWHAKKPDLDKLLRALFDGLTGALLRDDSQVYSVKALKAYAEPARVEVVIEELA